MAKQHIIASQHHAGGRGSLKTYTIGFILSIILTLAAYVLTTQGSDMFSYGFIVFSIISLAVVQLAVQLQYFIHLGHDSKPGWNKLIFLFMLLVLLIVVVGSLWIMSNIHYNSMSPNETESYIIEEEGITR